MANRIELNQMGIGGIAIVVVGLGAAALFGSAEQVSRGFMDNAILAVAGETYSSHVRCGKQAPVKPSLLKSFVGLHQGQRVLIKGYNRNDAAQALKSAFPDCSISGMNREGRALWKRLI